MSCSQFKQQRLPAWQPLLSPGYVAALMTLVAVFFFPIGLGIVKLNTEAFDLEIRYDDQNPCHAAPAKKSFAFTADGVRYDAGCVYNVTFSLERPLKAPVFLYYGLTKFYQNHRRYSNSKSDAQLAGEPFHRHKARDLSPLGVPGELTGMSSSRIRLNDEVDLEYADFVYAPGGLIPWSMFNDSFTLYRVDPSELHTNNGVSLVCNGSAFSRATNEPIDETGKEIHQPSKLRCHKKGIAWDTDVSHKYKPLHFPKDEVAHRPVLWSASRTYYPEAAKVRSNDTCFNEGWYAGELGHSVPVTTDEDLMVWARVASMPTFRKLYRVIDEDLPAGKYVMQVHDHYDVASFGGEKRFVLATLSWMGGRNTYLASLYLFVGFAAGLAAVVLVILHKKHDTCAEKAVATLIAE